MFATIFLKLPLDVFDQNKTCLLFTIFLPANFCGDRNFLGCDRKDFVLRLFMLYVVIIVISQN